MKTITTTLLTLFVFQFANANPVTPQSEEVKKALIEEAQADADYYRHKVSTAVIIQKKAEVGLEFDRKNYNRIKKLYWRDAVSLEEFENAQREVSQSELNIQLMTSRIEELKAELRSAKARFRQLTQKLETNRPGVGLKSHSQLRQRKENLDHKDAVSYLCAAEANFDFERAAACYENLKIAGLYDEVDQQSP